MKKRNAMVAALEEMMAFPDPVVEPLTEEEVKCLKTLKGDELVEGINVAVEAIEQLECLITTMESAKADQNFGKYNLPLYQNSLESICKNLGVKLATVSQEAFGDNTVLSTEGLKDMASKVVQTIKALIARFVTWFKNTYTSKNAAMLKMAKGNLSAFSKLNAANWDPKATTQVRSKTFCGLYFHYNDGHFRDLDHLCSIVFRDIPKIDKIIGELKAATNTMNGLLSNKKEDYNEVMDALVVRYAEVVGPKATYHVFAELLDNSHDTRQADEKNTIVLDSVGEFSAAEKICKEFVSKGFHLHDTDAGAICHGVMEISSKLSKLVNFHEAAVTSSVLKPIRTAIEATNKLCFARVETLWYTYRLIGSAMRVAIGEKPFAENAPYINTVHHNAGNDAANRHQQEVIQQNNNHYFQQQQMNNF